LLPSRQHSGAHLPDLAALEAASAAATGTSPFAGVVNFRARQLPSSGASTGPSSAELAAAAASAVPVGQANPVPPPVATSAAGAPAGAPGAAPGDVFDFYDADKNQGLSRAEFSKAHAEEIAKAVAQAIKNLPKATPAPTLPPIIITSYRDAMAWVLGNMKKINLLAKSAVDIREKYNILEKHVSAELVNMTLDQQIWETVRHEAMTNTRLIMRLGNQASELGGIFHDIGNGTTGMIKTLNEVGMQVGSFNTTIAKNVTRIENTISNFTNGSGVIVNLEHLVGNGTIFMKEVKKNTTSEIKKHLRVLINETRVALRNLTKESSEVVQDDCNPC